LLRFFLKNLIHYISHHSTPCSPRYWWFN